MLKIGVIGTGHLGKIHVKCIQLLQEEFELVGFYDESIETREAVSAEFGIKAFDAIDSLLEEVDCIDIVTPTTYHFEVAKKAITKFKHVFIEKPITNTIQEGKILLNLAKEANVKIQVGHVERFNPAFQKAQDVLNDPKFVEVHRLAQFNPRGTDVPVVLDLMIHDIDIVLSTINSNIKRISASGVSIISETPDIANARLEFDNGSVANLTASRISLKNMRKARFFQEGAYVSVDFLEKKYETVEIEDHNNSDDNPFALVLETQKGKKEIIVNQGNVEEINAIQEELRAFNNAIVSNTEPIVSGSDGLKALEVAHQILDKLKANSEIRM